MAPRPGLPGSSGSIVIWGHMVRHSKSTRASNSILLIIRYQGLFIKRGSYWAKGKAFLQHCRGLCFDSPVGALQGFNAASQSVTDTHSTH